MQHSDRPSAPTRRPMLCRSHPDFHMPADVVVGEGFDGDLLGRQLKEAGADSIAIFAKCHYGHAYYPTTIGTVHPQLRCDLLGEAVKGCRRHGIGVTAYLSVFYDSAAVTEHPQWALQTAPSGKTFALEADHFSSVCVNSGYIEESLIPQSLEVIEKYDVDELFFDTMTWFRPCFCEKCRAGFGAEIPSDENEPHWLAFVAWYKNCFDQAFANITTALKEAKPEVGVVFNWRWGVRDPTTPPPGIDHLSSDFRASGRIASYHGRYFSSTGLTYDYMCGRFMHGLGDWDTTTDETLLCTASAAIANGAGYYIIDRMLPDGTLEPRAYDAMKTVFSHINDRRACVESTTAIPDIAVLSSYNAIIGKKLERYAKFEERSEHMKAVEGVGQIFMERGRHFTAISEENLRRDIDRYRMVVIPEQAALSDSTLAAVRGFVEQGGHALISLASNGEQEALCDLAGITHHGYGDTPYAYLGTEQPFHIKQPLSIITAEHAEVLYHAKTPLSAGTSQTKFGHGLAPYTQADLGPIVTRRQRGKGTVTAIAGPLFTAYLNHTNPSTQRLVLALIDQVMPSAPVRIQTKALVELSLRRKGADLIIHLVNHSGHETISGWVFPMTDYVPQIHDIRVQIQVGNKKPRITHCPTDEDIRYEVANGVAAFVEKPLEFMNSLIVHDYFTDS